MGIKLSAAIWAGIAAGVFSTLAQVVLWVTFTDLFPSALFRDARLTAAIIMGPEVLPPPATFNATIMLVATLIHFSLSIIYGIILAYPAAWLVRGVSVLVFGALFGTAIYGINLYGFTVAFPWFTEVRGGNTLAAHIIFGLTCAGAYKVLALRNP
jgi:hypothetical protein